MTHSVVLASYAILGGVLFTGTVYLSAANASTISPLVVVAPPLLEEGAVRTVIHYADLNLANRAGELTLARRLRQAVTQVCEGFDHGAGVNLPQMRCQDVAASSALPQVALAIRRAREIALTGKSSVAASLGIISISVR